MQITVKPGRYVVAVSGGVDSMVLLDLLQTIADIELVVAHLDHGIRTDSSQDRLLVETMANRYGMPFEYEEAKLGPMTGEADARAVRYAFLETVRIRHNAQAIITAHHQDDVLETAVLNLLRGTGRKGLSSLQSSDVIIRPLLRIPKQDIRSYAKEHNIKWREDSTNQDERYLRNFVRRQLLTRLSTDQKQQLADRLLATAAINEELDTLLLDAIQANTTDGGLGRQWFISLPYDVSAEVMAAWLRKTGIRDFDRKAITRLVIAAKTALPGKRVDIAADNQLYVGRHYLRIARR
jgi:tRNA(Ile)-lysidine synthase